MSLYAISDLHLSLGVDKPMDVFGTLWEKHHVKIMNNWNKKITNADTVLLAGDTSWALKMEEAKPDLDFIDELNGKKLFIKGNHDYWWNAITKLNKMYNSMKFIQNNFFSYENYGICGTRGWASVDGTEEHDEKVYNRELQRLRMSLNSAAKAGYNKFIVMLHYPPKTRISTSQEFLDILDEYSVEKLIYGHIHMDAKAICINSNVNGIEYFCTSADIIDFDPIKIL